MIPDLIEEITVVMSALYGTSRSEIPFAELRELSRGLAVEGIDRAVDKLQRSDLIVVSVIDGVVRKTGPGLNSFVERTYLAQSLGAQYIRQSSAAAIVHIIVEGTNHPTAGATGFYCAEVGGRVVTAEHCVSGREILSIRDESGRVLHNPPIEVLPIVQGLDLAVVNVVVPEGGRCLNAELDEDEIVELMRVYVAGFPQVPQQQVSLYWRTAELAGISENYSRRKSYLINKVTTRGYSGGPALSENGLVVGVVLGAPFESASTSGTDFVEGEQAPQLIQPQYDSEYSVLTPASYLRELWNESSLGNDAES